MMKKLLVLILALTMVFPLCISAMAVENDSSKSFSVYTGDSSDTYYSNRRINVVLNVRDIYFGTDDGISALEFDIYYDKNLVTPVTSASSDADGDKGDFTKLMNVNPGGWEGFGVLDTEIGSYSLVFSDNSGENIVTEDDELIIKISFLVKEKARVNDIVFNFDNVIAYNRNLESKAEINLDSVVVNYSMQPLSYEDLPADSIPLHVAGYRHDINNVVYYASYDITIGDFIRRYCDSANDQHKMSNFAVLVADLDGIITYLDLNADDSSDKSRVVIPAKHYIIGVSEGNTTDYNKLVAEADLGKRITLYNLNIEATGKRTTAANLNRAGFTISEAEENKPPVIGGDDPDEPIIPPDPDIVHPNPDDEHKWKLGDVNENGEIDSMDYVYLKRAYFGTYKLKNPEVGDINRNGEIDSMDYVYLKRAYFGTYVIKE